MEPTIQRQLDVVIPVFNEEHILAQSVEHILKAKDLFCVPFHLVICNNGSTDGTGEVARQLASVHENVEGIDLDQKGRGRALKFIWSRTAAKYSLYMDVDLSTDLTAVPAAIELLNDGADLVMGTRLHPASRVQRSMKRELISRTYNLVVNQLFRVPKYTDMQCGFKAVRTDRFRLLSERIENTNWFFDTEMVLLALAMEMDVRALPVVWHEDTDSRVNIVPAILEDIQGLVRLRRAFASRGRIQAAVETCDKTCSPPSHETTAQTSPWPT